MYVSAAFCFQNVFTDIYNVNSANSLTASPLGETGASCYTFQLKSLLKSTYALNALFVLIQCTVPLTFHNVVM